MHNLSSFEVSGPPLPTMSDADASHRRKVEDVLLASREIEYFSVRCISTQNPIDESRLPLVEAYASQAEQLRKIRPPMPIVVASSPAADGSFPTLRVVAPRSAVVEMVRGKPTRSVSVSTDTPLRIWKSDIERILVRIGKACEESLEEGVEALVMLSATKQTLRRLNTTLGSPSARRRMRRSRAELESQREVVRALNDLYHDQRIAIVRSTLNRNAIERFFEEGCKHRSYIFRERRM